MNENRYGRPSPRAVGVAALAERLLRELQRRHDVREELVAERDRLLARARVDTVAVGHQLELVVEHEHARDRGDAGGLDQLLERPSIGSSWTRASSLLSALVDQRLDVEDLLVGELLAAAASSRVPDDDLAGVQ